MAKIIGTTDISSQIEKIIKEAKIYLLLITPYIRFNDRLKNIYKNYSSRLQNNFLIYKESEINKYDKEIINSITNLKRINLENLHAKCYLNENIALITSMNLHKYSEKNNFELGILLDSKEDHDMFIELLNEIRLMFQKAKSEKDFDSIYNQINKYTFKNLYNELTKKYKFEATQGEYGVGYYHICKVAMNYYNFSKDELYQNGEVVLKTTRLTRSVFFDLFNIIATSGTLIE